jgi:hypothetical protein
MDDEESAVDDFAAAPFPVLGEEHSAQDVRAASVCQN